MGNWNWSSDLIRIIGLSLLACLQRQLVSGASSNFICLSHWKCWKTHKLWRRAQHYLWVEIYSVDFNSGLFFILKCQTTKGRYFIYYLLFISFLPSKFWIIILPFSLSCYYLLAGMWANSAGCYRGRRNVGDEGSYCWCRPASSVDMNFSRGQTTDKLDLWVNSTSCPYTTWFAFEHIEIVAHIYFPTVKMIWN